MACLKKEWVSFGFLECYPFRCEVLARVLEEFPVLFRFDNDKIHRVTLCFEGTFQDRNRGLFMLA